MQAVLQTGVRQLTLGERPDPGPLKKNEVLFQVGAVGICGSDLHYYRTGRIGDQVIQFPFALGHECAGTVIEVGAAVEDLEPGDRIAVDPAVSCFACDQCRAGREHTCRHLLFLGCPGQLEGCLSQRYVLPAACCYKVDPGLSLEKAALVEPLSIGLYALQRAGAAPDARIGILGAGPIGLSVLAAARAAGLQRIYLSEPLEYRRRLALENGALAACDPVEDPASVFGELDLVFDCCGIQTALEDGCRLLTPGGRLVVVGIPETNRVFFDPHLLRRRELTLINVRRQNGCMRPAIELVEKSGDDLDYMLTHRFELTETPAAFELVDSYRDGVVKAVVQL